MCLPFGTRKKRDTNKKQITLSRYPVTTYKNSPIVEPWFDDLQWEVLYHWREVLVVV